MDADEFRRRGCEMLDYVANYLENIRERPAYPPPSLIQPGFLAPMLAPEAPQDPEPYENIIADVERVIMPGVTHWHSPRFFAYFATATSYPSMIADILSDAIGCMGFSWASSPSCTELETLMMDWLGKALKLPDHFLFESKGKGGGVIHGTASEATLTALLAARSRAISDYTKDKSCTPGYVIDRLVIFTSEQAHSSVERAGMLGAIQHIVKVDTDDDYAMRGDQLQKAIDEAVGKGLIPFFITATLGTTGTCAFDNLKEIGNVVSSYNANAGVKTPIWLHVDAAYAGSGFICPEWRPLLDGIEFADSFNFNPHKSMLVNFDCSVIYFRDASFAIEAFKIEPLYLKHDYHGDYHQPDYRHWQIPFGRRFRSLKLFFVLRSYGLKAIQDHIRSQFGKAFYFERLVKSDSRFEIATKVIMGLVCFRLKIADNLDEDNANNEALYKAILADNRIHLVPTKAKGKYIIRLAIAASRTNEADLDYAWNVIKECAQKVATK